MPRINRRHGRSRTGCELAALLASSRSPDVRRSVLELFTELGIGEGETAARAIVAEWQTGDAGVTAAAAAYLASRRADTRR